MMKFNDFQKYEATLRIPYEKYFELIYETKYLIEARLSPERRFIATKSFYGCNRRMAVEKVVAWYNKHLKAVLGHPHQTLMINDPMGEVSYEDGFVCTDLQNKYLDDETIERLLDESGGDLGRDDSQGTEKHSPASVKRLRRGTIYFKMKDLPCGESAKVRTRKIKLASKSLEKAEKEVVRRGLNKFENCPA
jgi:hypothetical protein